jgi:4-hydroxybenzoate polyprenyltransferase
MLFGTGALIMRSAGCTINDMWDKDFDKQVERTNKRPLASGTITYPQAWGFLAAQLSAGLGILLQLNWYSVALGASSLGLVAAYPLMKRVTYWPQAFLGLTFNYGAILGWAAVHGSCAWPVVLPLYAGGVAWTIVYDTLYAHQDKKDDAQIGVRSTALLFGDNTKPILNAFAVATIAGIGSAGYAAGLDWPFYAGLLGGAGHLAWQVNTANVDDPINLQQRFGSNKWFGALMFASIVAGKVV